MNLYSAIEVTYTQTIYSLQIVFLMMTVCELRPAFVFQTSINQSIPMRSGLKNLQPASQICYVQQRDKLCNQLHSEIAFVKGRANPA